MDQQLFETQPKEKLSQYEYIQKQFIQYQQNINIKLVKAFNDQQKSIKRKKKQLQTQLQHLREKYFNERKRIREMQEYFVKNYVNAINNDMKKWQQNKLFFNQLFQHYQYEIEIQSLINQRKKQKIKTLKQELKLQLKQNIKQLVQQKFIKKQTLNKSGSNINFRSKKCISVKSEVKLKTQASQRTLPTSKQTLKVEKQSSKKRKITTECDDQSQIQIKQFPTGLERNKRIKTQMSLPTLKKQKMNSEDIQNFNFMKPIRTLKKSHNKTSIIPQIISIFQEYNSKIHQKQVQIDWFQKVVFNKRNFQKLILHLNNEQLNFQNSIKKKYSQTGNKVKQLVAKNLFRLKTQSCSIKNTSNLKEKDRSIIEPGQKKSKTKRTFY